MKKQKSKKKISKTKKINELNDSWNFPELFYLGVALLLFIVYFLFSTYSVGFYQHDEVAHFINMQDFWVDPKSILGIWAKPGFKLIYVLPSLTGAKGVIMTNCLFSAFAAYFAGLAAREFGFKDRLLVMLLCGFIPMFYQMSFRNYSELSTAFLLALMIYLYQKERFFWAALAASYLFALRQEMALIGIVLGFLFLMRKQFIPILGLAAAPFLLNLIGGIVTGSPLFLLDQLTGGAGNYLELGFFHLWKMFVPSVGTVTTLLFLIGFFGLLFSKEGWRNYLKKYEILYISFFPVFLFWCLITEPQFTLIKLGANLRQLTSLSPAFALFAGLGFHLLRQNDKKINRIGMAVSTIFAVLVLSYFSYEYNHLFYTEVPDYSKIIVLLIGVLLIFGLPKLGVSYKKTGLALGVLALVHTIYSEKPIPLALEDQAVKEMADFFKENNLTSRSKILTNHTLFNYYIGNNAFERKEKYGSVPVPEELSLVPSGSIVIWDSHYTQRSSQVGIDFFQNNPQFKLLNQKMTDDKRFYIAVFEKN